MVIAYRPIVTASSVPRLRLRQHGPDPWLRFGGSTAPVVCRCSGVNDMLSLLAGQFRQDLVGRLAQRLGGPQRADRRITQAQSTSRHGDPSSRRVLNILDHATLDQVLVTVHLGGST